MHDGSDGGNNGGGSERIPAPFPTAPPTSTVTETLQLFSHDIRAAMSDVIGGLRLVDRARLDAETGLQLDRVQAAGDTLAALVDAALMAAAGETLIQTEDEAMRLQGWIDTLSVRWSGRAREEQCAFSVETEGTMPGFLLAPQVSLDRIVGNLVGNALKHAGGAPVTLGLSATPHSGLAITVRDAGTGYPEQILTRMARGAEPVAMGRTAGSGLGLRIAAELTRQIGGVLTMSNDGPGGGGCAELFLPERLLVWDASEPPPCEPPDLSGLRLLVAEDNLTNQTILRQLLAKMRAEPVFVSDGVAALEQLEAQPFDMALIDIEMPRLSGIEVMRATRARRDAVAAMPMVALTAYVLRDNREAIYAAGADGIIGKPISSGAEFGRAILRYVGRPTGRLEAEDVLAGRGNDGAAGAHFDTGRFAALIEVAGEDGRDELLQRLHEDLVSVRDALDAGVAAGRTAEIRSQTHILIAISGAVGGDRLHQLAEVLNIAAKRQRIDDLAALYAPCRADLEDLIAYVVTQAGLLGTTLHEAQDGPNA